MLVKQFDENDLKRTSTLFNGSLCASVLKLGVGTLMKTNSNVFKDFTETQI